MKNCSPNGDQPKEAPKVREATEFDVEDVSKHKVELIDFHPIPTCQWDVDKLIDEEAAFNVKLGEVFTGSVHVNLSVEGIIGIGVYKSAHAARLTLYPLRHSGLGSKPTQQIVVKRPHMGADTTPPFVRPSLSEEYRQLYQEANTMYWAKALLKMSYDYVDRAIQDAGEAPPFEIPRFRFVDAALLLAYAERPGGALSGKGETGNLSSVYLAEELLPSTNPKDFVKFIKNGDSELYVFSDPATKNMAEFLAFTQHVQYTKTGGKAYVADYQGCPPLLTDPQILTQPDVSIADTLFDDGNVKAGAELFEKHHLCNKFCFWPGFGLDSYYGHSNSVHDSSDS